MWIQIWLLAASLLHVLSSADDSARIIREQVGGNEHNLTYLNTVIAPPWVSAQLYRSTTSILWSCIVTLTACVYTALHLNISSESGWWPRLLAKLKWVAIGIFVPEYVIYLALIQFLEARWISKQLTQLQKLPDSTSDSEYEFDLNYGFFVVMGGFRVSLEYLSETKTRGNRIFGEILDDDCQETLSPIGVVALARAGEFIHIPPESITDRSKANSIQKGLVFVQIVWMALQCIARKAYGLPLTLLEAHILIHVGCALIMYSFWFKKPLDIASTETIDTSGFRETINLLLLEHHAWKEIVDEKLRIAPVGSYKVPRSETESNRYNSDNNGPDRLLTQTKKVNDDLEFATTADIETSFVHTGTYKPDASKYLPCGLCFETSVDLSEAEYMALESAVNAYWLLDRSAFTIAETYRPKLIGRRVGPDLGFLAAHQFKKARAPFQRQSNVMRHWKRTKHHDMLDAIGVLSERKVTLFIIIPLSMVYGGLHCTAWGFHFPSQLEEFLWKLASILVSGFVVVVALSSLFTLALASIGFIQRCWGGRNYVDDGTFDVIIYPIVAAVAICFVFSRAFLVVEAFISLRSLPAGVYIMPEWLQMIPHL